MTCPKATQPAPVPNRPRIPVFPVQTECASYSAGLPINPLLSLPPAGKGMESLYKGHAGSGGGMGKQTAMVSRAFAGPGAHQVPSTFGACDPHGDVLRDETEPQEAKPLAKDCRSSQRRNRIQTQAVRQPGHGHWALWWGWRRAVALGLTLMGVSLFSQRLTWPFKKCILFSDPSLVPVFRVC